MEIIEELEPVRRGPYTGSFGYIGWNGDLDLNIIIRTLVMTEQQGYLQVGAGIVADSDPAKEYEETLHKAQAFFSSVRQGMMVWIYLNDRFVKEEEALVSVFDHGFLYGDGVYETIRSYGHKIFMRDQHLARLAALGRRPLACLFRNRDWPSLLHEAMARNGVGNEQHGRLHSRDDLPGRRRHRP